MDAGTIIRCSQRIRGWDRVRSASTRQQIYRLAAAGLKPEKMRVRTLSGMWPEIWRETREIIRRGGIVVATHTDWTGSNIAHSVTTVVEFN